MAEKKKTETKTEKKADKPADSGTKSDSKSEDKSNASSKSYDRGENQKPVTKAYRSNWDSIFGKKEKDAAK